MIIFIVPNNTEYVQQHYYQKILLVFKNNSYHVQFSSLMINLELCHTHLKITKFPFPKYNHITRSSQVQYLLLKPRLSHLYKYYFQLFSIIIFQPTILDALYSICLLYYYRYSSKCELPLTLPNFLVSRQIKSLLSTNSLIYSFKSLIIENGQVFFSQQFMEPLSRGCFDLF